MQRSALTGLDILIIEDDALLRKQIASYLEKLGAEVTQVGTYQGAKQLLQELTYDFVLLDFTLPDGSGLSLLKEKVFPANTGVIIITAEGNVSTAVEAMRLGATDYLAKPFDPGELPLVIERAKSSKQSARRTEHRRSAEVRAEKSFFFGESLAPLKSQIEKIISADQRIETSLPPVLIQGETGTGKTTIARWIHHHGPRANQPLVEVNCSALPEQLAEAELFGHEKGAFTDARSARMGLFEAANGGTLFLDELPSLSLPLQAKVLTAIEDQNIRRLGRNKPIPVDVRLIAAASRDLKELVAEGQFREDLFHRLDLFRLNIAPLRERGDDILELAKSLLEQVCKRYRIPTKKIHPEGAEKLKNYHWPGNVRELSHELERSVVFEEEEELHFIHLLTQSPPESRPTGDQNKSDEPDWFNENYRFPESGFSLEAAINRLIQHALNQTDQNVSAAARLLGVSRDYLRYRLSGQKTK